MRPQCPKMRPYAFPSKSVDSDRVRTDSQLASNLITPPPPPPPVRGSDRNVSVVEIAIKSSALNAVKVREVTATTTEDKVNLKQFVNRIEKVDRGDSLESDGTDETDKEDEDPVPVMAGERARHFSDLPPEFDGDPGPSSQHRRTSYAADDEEEEKETPGRSKA